MMFRKRIERAFRFLKEGRAEEPSPKELAKRNAQKNIQTEKGDFWALLLSAWMVIVPIALLVLLLVVGLPLLLIYLLG